MGNNLVYFPKGDNQISVKIMASRLYPYKSAKENHIEKRLKEVEEEVNIEK